MRVFSGFQNYCIKIRFFYKIENLIIYKLFLFNIVIIINTIVYTLDKMYKISFICKKYNTIKYITMYDLSYNKFFKFLSIKPKIAEY